MRDPGRMNKRVTLQGVGRSGDGGGGFSEAPLDLGSTWASIDPLEGNEQTEAMKTGMQRPVRVVIRYRPGFTSATGLLYGDRKFDVRSVVDPNEAHEVLVLFAEEIFE